MPGIPESEVFWLNVTNIGLGLATLACVGVAAWGVVRELAVRAHHRAALHDVHAAFMPELGLTMADGGEKVEEEKKDEEKKG